MIGVVPPRWLLVAGCWSWWWVGWWVGWLVVVGVGVCVHRCGCGGGGVSPVAYDSYMCSLVTGEAAPDVGASDVGGGGVGELVGLLGRVEGLLDEVGVLLERGAGVGSGVSGVLVGLVGVGRRVEALTAGVGALVESGGEWSGLGFGSARAWLVGCTNTSVSWAGRVFVQGRAVGVCPLLVGAWRAGRVQWEHVRVVVDAHRRFPRVRAALTLAEPDIVRAACAVDPEMLARELFGLLHELDPDAVDEAVEKRRRGEVGLHVSTLLDGFVRVDGLLPPEVGQCLVSVLTAARQSLRRNPSHPAATGDGPASDGPASDSPAGDGPGSDAAGGAGVVGRSVSQRNVEALQFVLGVAASVSGPAGLASVQGSRPVLHVQVSTASLVDGSAPGWIENVAGGRLTPVTASAAQRVACDSVTRLLVVDDSGTVDAISAKRRVVSGVMRQIVRGRDDGTCRFPGCRSMMHEVHHVVHWAHGGATTSGNLAGLCWHHHRLVHEGRWQVHGDANTLIVFTSDRGHRYPSRPPDRGPRLTPPRSRSTPRTTQRC